MALPGDVSADETPTPDGWTSSDTEKTKYGSQPVAAFDHETDDVSIHVRPDGPSETGEGDRWRVDAVRGEVSNPERLETVERDIEGRDRALDAAASVMERYDGDIDSVTD